MMNIHSIFLITLTAFTLSACNSTAPKITPKVGVLEKVNNLEVHPQTNSNSVQLVKFPQFCIIEFSANIDGGLANEKWQFKGNTLISATSTIVANDGIHAGEAFNLYDPIKQDNFIALKSHFNKSNIDACN